MQVEADKKIYQNYFDMIKYITYEFEAKTR